MEKETNELDPDLLQMILDRPKCETKGCDQPATGTNSVYMMRHAGIRMFHRRWCCDQHIQGSDWRSIKDTNWWYDYKRLTGNEPEL
jgi:hypothetical protein